MIDMSDMSGDNFLPEGAGVGGEMDAYQEPDYGYEPAYEDPADHERERRLVAEATLLVHDFPELGQDEALAQQAVQQAHQLAHELDRPELAGEPALIRLAIESGRVQPPAPQGQAGEQGRPRDAFDDVIAGQGRGAGCLPFG